MNILIVEDEARIAKRLKRMVLAYFGEAAKIIISDSLVKAVEVIQLESIDLLLLDLNLNGEDGFDLLGTVVAGAFHTIVVSANTDRAIEAFGYGVLDFIAKPFDEDRLFEALDRLVQTSWQPRYRLRFLAVKKAGAILLIDVVQVIYIKGAGIYSEIHLKDGKTVLHDKSLDRLQQLLSSTFERVHKSYLVCMNEIDKLEIQSGSRNVLLLKNGEILPIGRSRYPVLREKFL